MFSETTSFPISVAFTYPLLKKRHKDMRQAPASTKKPGAKPSSGSPTSSEPPSWNIRSGGKGAPVAEGTARESPDMNTTPDACGGSVSSF
jgi:hypothetical protein